MRKYLWLLLLPVVFFPIVRFAMVTMAEYTETGSCYRIGSKLSLEEMRSQTIRSLLTAEMESSARENKYQTWVQTFLIRKSLTSKDVIDAVTSKSIVNLPQMAAYPLNTKEDIARIDPKFLRGEFSIVRYGAGNVQITPSSGIEAVDAKVVQKRLDSERRAKFNLSLFERALGYGNNYFQVEAYWFINLACCDEYSTKDGKTPEWYTRQIVKSIITDEQPVRRHLVVSNCGDVLHRSEDGYTWSVF